MTKTLVFIRHGHRDTSQRDMDNGLDTKGQGQARSIKAFFHTRFADGKDVWLVSSPKRRCQETLEPLAKSLNCEVDSHPGLDEQKKGESDADFESRVGKFLEEWMATSAPLTLVCSHGDWLPIAIKQLLGIHQEFKKGSWLELEMVGSQISLKWYIPTFKFFGGILTK